MSNLDFYETSDIALGTALACLGYLITDVEKQPGCNRATFTFKKDEQFDDFVQLYFNHQLKVDALDYFNSLKEVKTRLYNLKG